MKNYNPFELREETKQRIQSFPKLKKCVESFVALEGNSEKPDRIPDLIYYIKCMDIYEPQLFRWSKEDEEEFCSWGHNSRYVHVLWPLLFNNLDEYVNIIVDAINWSDWRYNVPDEEKEWFYKEEED